MQKIHKVGDTLHIILIYDKIQQSFNSTYRQGGVVQVVVPAELGYPLAGDPDHNIVGPK